MVRTEGPSTSRTTSPPPEVGRLLRHWRTVRRLSQLQLALDAGISARHVSYVETGRARPSRDMILHLADALDIPLRERNALLLAGGFAPRYVAAGLDAPALAHMRAAIDLILRHQEPYPAFLLDRHWNILMANRAAERSLRFLLDADPGETNMIRLAVRPDGLRPVLVNWEEIAGDLIRHLHGHIAAVPWDDGARKVLEEVLAYPDVPDDWRTREPGIPAAPLLTTHFRRRGVELRFFSTITQFGSPHDVTLEELRIECSFPADEGTARHCRELFA